MKKTFRELLIRAGYSLPSCVKLASRPVIEIWVVGIVTMQATVRSVAAMQKWFDLQASYAFRCYAVVNGVQVARNWKVDYVAIRSAAAA